MVLASPRDDALQPRDFHHATASCSCPSHCPGRATPPHGAPSASLSQPEIAGQQQVPLAALSSWLCLDPPCSREGHGVICPNSWSVPCPSLQLVSRNSGPSLHRRPSLQLVSRINRPEASHQLAQSIIKYVYACMPCIYIYIVVQQIWFQLSVLLFS
jgi:hypothetical protein